MPQLNVRPTNPNLDEFVNLAKLGRSSAAPLHLPFANTGNKTRAATLNKTFYIAAAGDSIGST
jgi:hypothetical protein